MTDENKPLLEGGKPGEFKAREASWFSWTTVITAIVTAAYSQFTGSSTIELPMGSAESGPEVTGVSVYLIDGLIIAGSGVVLLLKDMRRRIRQ